MYNIPTIFIILYNDLWWLIISKPKMPKRLKVKKKHLFQRLKQSRLHLSRKALCAPTAARQTPRKPLFCAECGFSLNQPIFSRIAAQKPRLERIFVRFARHGFWITSADSVTLSFPRKRLFVPPIALYPYSLLLHITLKTCGWLLRTMTILLADYFRRVSGWLLPRFSVNRQNIIPYMYHIRM